jgi:UPF0755 protein
MKKLALILAFLLVVGGVGGAAAWRYYMAPVNPQDHQTKLISVSKGQSFTSVAAKLTEAGLIRHPYVLRIAAYQTDKNRSIQAGSFKLSPSMTPEEILENMAHGRLDISVTILEGWRREEIADSLATVFTDNNLSFDKAAFLAATKGKEGYLFPDTYLLPLTTDAGTVVSLLESTLQKKLTAADQQGIKASGHTLYEILTMASIVEREARTDESRKLVAGILWKRVANNWPIQADATLQFAKGYSKTEKTWWAEPLAVDKEINSPYNTYKNIGLPPGPICSPSLSSIEATIFPKESSAWYYITDTKGGMHYADTIQQHNKNVETYLR